MSKILQIMPPTTAVNAAFVAGTGDSMYVEELPVHAWCLVEHSDRDTKVQRIVGAVLDEHGGLDIAEEADNFIGYSTGKSSWSEEIKSYVRRRGNENE